MRCRAFWMDGFRLRTRWKRRSIRKELEQVEDEETQMAARQPQEQKKTQEKQKVKQQGEIVPL